MTFSHAWAARSNCACCGEQDYVAECDIESLLEAFRSIRDPRGKNGRQHEQYFVLAVCTVALLAGASWYSEIARKARDMSCRLLAKLGAKFNWFTGRWNFPSKGTIRRVLSGINAESLDMVLGEWLWSHAPRNTGGEIVIAVDGKVLRGSWTDENDQVTLFSAMIHREQVTIAQVRVPDGTNEITQAEDLLSALPVTGDMPALFTLDAAHTQVETAKEISKRDNWHYLMEVKGNQPKLHRAVFDKVLPLFQDAAHHVMEDDLRGSRKVWSCWLTDADGIEFPGVAQVGAIWREEFNRSGDRISKGIAYVLTSKKADSFSAADLNRDKRNHWGIENGSHYIRDTVYREDLSQVWDGNGSQNLACMRNLAIGQMRLKGISDIKETIEWVAGNRDRALTFMDA